MQSHNIIHFKHNILLLPKAPLPSSPEREVWEDPPNGVAGPSNPHRLHHARVLELVEDHLVLEPVLDFVAVGLDAADKVGVGLA